MYNHKEKYLYPDEEQNEVIVLHRNIYNHRNMFVNEDDQEGGYVDKCLLHDKKLDIHIKGKSSLIRGRYSMEVSVYYEKNMVW